MFRILSVVIIKTAMERPFTKNFKNFEWIVIDEPNRKELERAFAVHKIDGIDLDSVLKQDSRAKLDTDEDYAYLKLNFLKYYEATDEFKINEMHNVYRDDLLITVTTYPTRKLTSVVDEYSKKDFLGTPEELLSVILDRQVSKGSRIVDYIEEGLDALEKNAYAKITKESIRLIAQKRKNIIVLKHNLDSTVPVLEALLKLSETEFPKLSSNCERLVDKAHKSHQEVRVLEESADGFDSTIKALFEVKNNEIIKVISVASFVFIPLNLIAGIFGMNVENVPFAHQFVI